MKSHNLGSFIIRLYVVLFLAFMLLPLIVMAGAAFNDSRFPSVYPWKGFTGQWFVELWNDGRMWGAARNTVLVALAVVAMAVPIGTAGAILVNHLRRGPFGDLWHDGGADPDTRGGDWHFDIAVLEQFRWPAGLHLSMLGQVSYIASFVMLLVLARLQSFDAGLEEAALDLGATHAQVMRRILLPHLYPAIGAGAAISFFPVD